MIQEFRVIPGFNAYGVAANGQIKRLGTEALLKPRASKHGYLSCSVRSSDGRVRSLLVHRAVAFAWIGPPPFAKACVAHLDGDKANNNADNLKWVTYQENEGHKRIHGTVRLGSQNHASVLTEEQVVEMKTLNARGLAGYWKLARLYGISTTTAKQILRGEIWKHVSALPETSP